MELTQKRVELSVKKINEKIEELGTHTNLLYEELNTLQNIFDAIRNIPSEKRLVYEKQREIRLNWKQQAEKIDTDYNTAVAKNAGIGAAGVGVGVAVAALGPTAAMGIATTFGVASTGTAISTLSGAAATKAALAWLGGGALTAGGGGIAAGNFLLSLTGPVGWAIAGIALLGSGMFLLKNSKEKKRLEKIFILISKRDIKSYELAIVEFNERISRIIDESKKLRFSIERIEKFGLDYNNMTEAQQYELGSYVNLMNASTQLLTNPILGLQPKYNMEDLERFIVSTNNETLANQSSLIIFLSNLLYKIKLDDKDKKLLWRSFRGDKSLLSSLGISKNEFEFSVFETVSDALEYKYGIEKAVSV